MSEPLITPQEAVKLVIPIDVGSARAEMARILAIPSAIEFIRHILKTVSEMYARSDTPGNTLVEGGDVLKIFDVIQDQGGVFRANDPRAKKGGANLALGAIATGDAAIQIGVFRPGVAITRAELVENYRRTDPPTVLHETLHHAGRFRYTDQDYANVVSQMPGVRDPLPETTNPFTFSAYWDKELKKQCNIR